MFHMGHNRIVNIRSVIRLIAKKGPMHLDYFRTASEFCCVSQSPDTNLNSVKGVVYSIKDRGVCHKEHLTVSCVCRDPVRCPRDSIVYEKFTGENGKRILEHTVDRELGVDFFRLALGFSRALSSMRAVKLFPLHLCAPFWRLHGDLREGG